MRGCVGTLNACIIYVGTMKPYIKSHYHYTSTPHPPIKVTHHTHHHTHPSHPSHCTKPLYHAIAPYHTHPSHPPTKVTHHTRLLHLEDLVLFTITVYTKESKSLSVGSGYIITSTIGCFTWGKAPSLVY